MKEPFLFHPIETWKRDQGLVQKGIVAHRIGTDIKYSFIFPPNVTEIILPVTNVSDSGNFKSANAVFLPVIAGADKVFTFYLFEVSDKIIVREARVLGSFAQCYLTVFDRHVSIMTTMREKSQNYFFTFQLSTGQLVEEANINFTRPLDLAVETKSKIGRILSHKDSFILQLFI